MTTHYTRNVLKMVVAQICQTIGWHSINSTPLEFMVDLMQEYLFQVSKLTQQYAQVLGRSDANLDDVGLAFRHMNIDLQELAEYVKNVDSVPCVVSVPKLPIHRDNHLNFLKPGSREVVTRPVHVHEHLPAMYPGTEEEYVSETKTEAANSSCISEPINTSEDESNEINVITTNGVSNEDSPSRAASQPIFKRPGDPISLDGPVVKRAKTTDEGRPLREIHSVIMTTSGFLSTAREGKLPEARTPQQARAETPPPPPSYSMVLPEVKVEKKLKKIPKKTVGEDSKPENKENKKKKIPKDTLFKPDEIKNVKVKKLTGMKELAKLKALKPGSKAASTNLAGPSNVATTKAQGKVPSGSPKHAKAAKVKAEKVVDVTAIAANPPPNERKEEAAIDKLPIEPDKQKLNIFKKISSKSKEDKEKESLDLQHKLKLEMCSRADSPGLSVEFERHRSDTVAPKQEDTKKIVAPSPIVNNSHASRVPVPEDGVTDMMSPGSDVYMFDDMSPPGTPSTPKTPELSVHSVTLEKKKKKDRTGKKKEPKQKTPRNTISPKKARLSNDSAELSVLDRPKTPQAPEQSPTRLDPKRPPAALPPFPFFPPFPAAPGLIPHPMFPLPLPKGMPGMPGVPPTPGAPMMPGMLRQRFYRPKLDIQAVGGGGRPMVPPSFVNEPLPLPLPLPPTPACFPLPKQHQQQHQHQHTMLDNKPRMLPSPDKELLSTKQLTSPMPPAFHVPEVVMAPPPAPMPAQVQPLLPPPIMMNSGGSSGLSAPLVPPSGISPAVVPAPLLPPNLPATTIVTLGTKTTKPEKPEKPDKKSKEHKKEKRDKLKKKKEKKEKHKDKGEKVKEKKDKSEKREKLEKIKEKKEKKEKRKEKELNKKVAKEEKVLESVPKITLKLGPAGGSPRPPTPDSALMKKITIKPPKKPEDESLKHHHHHPTQHPQQQQQQQPVQLQQPLALPTPSQPPQQQREPTPELARISALVTRPPKQKSTKTKAEAVPKKEDTKEDKENGGNTLTAKPTVLVDQSGRKVWICPACGKQDDGSPMIGCDDCDAWYHWVCVGIQVAPADNEDWYCRLCIAKKQEQYHDKKKKKRKKKVKVTA